MNKIKKINPAHAIIIAFYGVFSFLLSWVISPYHVYGDQEHYTKAYELISDLNIIDAFDIYRSVIYSFEPLHVIISWFFSVLGADKVIVMSVFNSLLSIIFARYLITKTRSYFLLVVILFSNYYLYTLFFTLEKLKFASIFLLLFLIYKKKIFALASIFTHMQMSIPLIITSASVLIAGLRVENFRKLFRLHFFLKFILLLIISVAFLLILYDYGSDKLLYYSSRDEVRDFSALIPVFIIYLATVISTNKNKIVVTWFYIFLMILIFLIGSDRLNMIAYFGFLHFTSYKGKFFAASFVFLSIYLGYKSIKYIEMIVIFGG